MAKAVIRIREDGSATMKTDFDVAFIEEFKQRIGYAFRRWNPLDRVWEIDADAVEDAVEVCGEWFEDVQVIPYKRPESRPPPGMSGDPSYAVLHLLPTAPVPLIHSAYKTLARLYHPDLGGDTNAMQRVNAAYDRLKERMGHDERRSS